MRAKKDPTMSAESHAEVVETERALARGDLVAAQQHLHQAIQNGAPANQTQWLATSIQTAAEAQERRVQSGGWRGFTLAIVGYLCVSLQQPLGWTVPLWIFLAFLLVPCLVGLFVGLQQRTGHAPGRSFWTAARSCGTAMGLYTIVHLLLLGGPHSDAADKWQERIAGVLTTLLFTLVAGLVAGTVSAIIVGTGMRVKERQI
jgi:hypothetical protein